MIEVATLLLIFVSCVMYFRRKPEKFPPGPSSLPILGNVLQLGTKPHKSIMAMRKKYGDIIGIKLGPKRAVFINDYGIIKEAFSLLSLSGRPLIPPYTLQGKVRGIVFTTGTSWKEHRKFAFSFIQSGFRNGVPIDSLITQEAYKLTEYLEKNCGHPITTTHLFNIPILNILWGIVAGESYELDDPSILKTMDHVREYNASPALQGIFVFFYELAKMFPKISGLKHFLDNFNPVLNSVQRMIDGHRETYKEGIQRDLIDCYLEKIGTTTDKNSPLFGKTGEENLLFAIIDIFSAGTETTAITLRWLILLMAHHPEKQDKLSNAISLLMQEIAHPSLKDRQKLPYAEAVIMEVMRFSSIIPVAIFHEAMEDVQFRGYLIPKGTMVVPNLYCVHHDPAVWGDPENFRPERFLNEDETEVIRHPALIPFSTGRRACPGEFLAREELFLFTLRIFQSFKVELDTSVPPPSLTNDVYGVVIGPVDHKVIFSERFI